jgi:hypothetical protein
MTTNINIQNVEVKFDGAGEYGVHDGFFNAIAVIDGVEYDFQCCAEQDGTVDLNDCGYDWGICADANEKIAEKIGWENLLDLIERAYSEYLSRYSD